MKTQTAEEFYHEKTKFGAPLTTNAEILNEFATTQIETLRERLRNKGIKKYGFEITEEEIDQTINEFLKEINDEK